MGVKEEESGVNSEGSCLENKKITRTTTVVSFFWREPEVEEFVTSGGGGSIPEVGVRVQLLPSVSGQCQCL